ncbi:MAG TPA: DUF2461 domain-containing protein [Candidatus Eisenbacteria bacterium]|nr:DUF2461 domain-containing protein [Candidatus Eisenbacteria bacterium]
MARDREPKETSMAASTATFTGFRREAVEFLADLAENNDRTWFQARKGDYERLLKKPLEALCVALDQEFTDRRIPLTADPRRSPFRIYRDVRFSKDKSPYKTNVGASFAYAERAADGSLAPRGDRRGGGYFHLQPGEIFVGGGMWHPEPGPLAAWRAAVANDPDRVHAAIDDPAFVARFGSVDGDRLKRMPAGFAAEHPDADLLTLKDVTFLRRLADDEAFSSDLPTVLATDLAAAVPLLGLLASLGS